MQTQGAVSDEDSMTGKSAQYKQLAEAQPEITSNQDQDVVDGSAISFITLNVFIGWAAAALGGLLFGFIIGVSSGIVTDGALLCDCPDVGPCGEASVSDWGYDLCYTLTDVEKGLVTSLNLIGAFISTLFCFKFGDILGRRTELLVSSVLFTLGSLIVVLGPNFFLICLGFVVYGFGIGFAMHAAPVYISEIAHERSRGLLVSCKEAVIVVGMLIGYLVGWIFQNVSHNWRFMMGTSMLFSVTLGIFVFTQSRSPRWLALRSTKVDDCDERACLRMEVISALKHFRSQADDIAILQEANSYFSSVDAPCMSASALDFKESPLVGSPKGAQDETSFLDVFKYKRALFIGCGLVILQQVTGQPSVLYYANNIFKAAGLGDNAAVASVLVATVKLLATIVSVLQVDKYGRRSMLFIGMIMMVMSLVLLAIGFAYQTCSKDGVSVANCATDDLTVPEEWGYVTVGALMLYVSGYQVGFGPVSWLIISEIFPLKVRGAAFSLAAASNFMSNILITFVFELLQTWLTTSGTYVFYAVLTVVSIAFTFCFVPETKGKSLEDIEKLLGYA